MADGPFTWIDGEMVPLTPELKARMEEQMAAIAEERSASTVRPASHYDLPVGDQRVQTKALKRDQRRRFFQKPVWVYVGIVATVFLGFLNPVLWIIPFVVVLCLWHNMSGSS